MKKIIAIILCIALCLSDMTVVMAENEQEETYCTINAEFSDKVGQLEKIQVMVKDDHVYANAEELATRLGYKMASDNECVLIYNQENESLPYGFTQFYIDDTKVTHTLFTEVVSSYEAPFETIKNDKGAWIPLEYSLLILNSGMMMLDNTILIDIPQKDIIDICFDIVNNNVHYTFEWSKDFGYIEDSFEHKVLTYLSHYINVFNGILQFDGDSWAQFFSEVQLNNSAYHSKYGKDLAMLICTSSNEELEVIINEVEIANDLLGKDKEMIGGKLGGILEKYSGNLDKEVGELYETCEKILEEVKKGNTDVVEYNRSYQALEDALDKQAWFSDLGGDAIMQLQSELSGVMSFLTVGAKMLEIVNYQEEFKNQDEFSVQAFSVYLEDAQRQASIPKETVSSMLEYSEKFQDDLLNYSLRRWWDEIAREIILEEAIGEVLTTKANVILLVWDLASNYIPVLSGGLSAAEKFELTLYASAFQYGAFENSRNYRIQLFEDVSDITPENLYKLAQYYYIYLKSCYITREAALGSLAGKMEIDSYREKLQPLIDYQNAINTDIAEMLVKLKEAETNNDKLVYGFLPEDNVEYLENYDDSKLIEVINQKDLYLKLSEYISNNILGNRLGNYSQDNIDYSKLLWFVYYHSYGSNKMSYEIENSKEYAVISEVDVNELLEKFFGVRVSCQRYGEIQYQDNKFYYPYSDWGDIGMPVAIIENVYLDENNRYNISFYDAYVYPENFENGMVNPLEDWDVYYGYSVQEAFDDPFCEIDGKNTCVLEKRNNDFVILEYIESVTGGEYVELTGTLILNSAGHSVVKLDNELVIYPEENRIYPDEHIDVYSVDEVGLMDWNNQYNFAEILGKRVLVKGTIMEAHTQYHYSQVMICDGWTNLVVVDEEGS